jgi:hypothetical protein
VALFSFLTGISSLPELLGHVSAEPTGDATPILAFRLDPKLALLGFCIGATVLLALSYFLSRFASQALFANRTEYGFVDLLVALTILIVFGVAHYSLMEISWGDPLKPLFTSDTHWGLGAPAGIVYMGLMFILTSVSVEVANLWPLVSVINNAMSAGKGN